MFKLGILFFQVFGNTKKDQLELKRRTQTSKQTQSHNNYLYGFFVKLKYTYQNKSELPRPSVPCAFAKSGSSTTQLKLRPRTSTSSGRVHRCVEILAGLAEHIVRPSSKYTEFEGPWCSSSSGIGGVCYSSSSYYIATIPIMVELKV